MFPIRTILFPIDFSDPCTLWAEQVRGVAQHFGATVIVLHVLQIPPYNQPPVEPYAPIIDLEALRWSTGEELKKFIKSQFVGVDVRCVLEEGDPALRIVEAARMEHVDVVMLPSHGRGWFRHLLLGSTTAKVLHDCDCPVWTGAHVPEYSGRRTFRSLVCGIDLKSDMTSAMEWAAAISASYEAQLTFVHAVPWYEDGAEHLVTHRSAIERASRSVENLVREMELKSPIAVHSGNIAQVMREAALRHQADLMVIGQGCIRKFMGRLRTNAYSIIREAPCPVIRV